MGNKAALAMLLIAVAFAYFRPLKRLRRAMGVNHLLATGHIFLLVGVLLGFALGDRNTPVAADLSPIVALAAGWVGFATGMRFEMRVLRTVPVKAFAVALAPAITAAAVVGGAGASILFAVGHRSPQAVASACILAAASANSGPTLIAMIRTRRPGRSSEARPVLRMIEFAAGIDDIVVILLAALTFAVFRTNGDAVAPALLIGAAVLGGTFLGGVTWLFLGGRATEDERLLLGLGMLAFIAGFAGWLRFSPAAVAAVAAMFLVNLPGQRIKQLVQAVQRVERPAVVVLMAVIGLHVADTILLVFFPLVFLLTIIRLLAKRWAGDFVAGSSWVPGLRTSPRWGDGLAPQGTLGLMVTLSFYHVWQDTLSRTILAAVATASIINEIIAPWLYVNLLRRISSAADMKRSTV